MSEMRKYPRTRHICGSHFQHGDHDLEAVDFEELRGKHLVVEEKVDGANFGISFEGGEMRLQSRGHFLRGGPRERQFELLKQWAATHEMALYELLGERYVCYGECMFACHTIWYDRLPHYFMEFDVLDTQTGKFLSTQARDNLLRGPNARVRIEPVRVMAAGYVKSLEEMKEMVGDSAFVDWTLDELGRRRAIVRFHKALCAAHNIRRSSDGWMDVADHARFSELSAKYDVGPTMEGLYVKWEEDGEVKGRFKFVRDTFLSSIAGQDEHWHDRPILQNQLAPGAMERMFEALS